MFMLPLCYAGTTECGRWVMAGKVRRQITLDAEQDALLKRMAQELGVSEAEVIRRGIEMVCGHVARVPNYEERMKALRESEAFIDEYRTEPTVPPTGRGWTRDDLYEERLSRYSH